MLTSCSNAEYTIPLYNTCVEEIESIDGIINWANRSKGTSISYSIHKFDYPPVVPLIEGYISIRGKVREDILAAVIGGIGAHCGPEESTEIELTQLRISSVQSIVKEKNYGNSKLGIVVIDGDRVKFMFNSGNHRFVD